MEIVAILDRSGSMMSTAKDAVGGFTALINEQKKIPGEVLVTLVQFDDVIETVYEARDIKEINGLVLQPRNTTALLDAIGKTINSVGDRLAKTLESDRPEKVLVVIITDGGENASKGFTNAKINEMIKTQRDTYNWEFVFIGANQDAIATASQFGIGYANAMTYAATSLGTNAAYGALSKGITKMRTSENLTASAYAFDDEDRAAQASAGA